jgi:hypothetical protein
MRRYFYRNCFPNLAVEYVIRNGEANQEGLKLNRTNQLMVYADIIIISLSESTYSMERNT